MHYEKFTDGTVKCIEGEIPFDLPDGWAWCRYSNAIELFSGQDLTPDRYNGEAIGIPYITGASNMEDGRVIINRWTSTPTTHATQGDLLLTVKGSGVGKMAYCDIPDAHIARQIMALRCNEGILYTYLEICVSASIMNLTAKANGLIPGISRDVVLSSLMPLPPLYEQKRVGLKVNQLLNTISYISRQDEDLKSAVNTAKSRILDLAIRGKLVPQDPNDEPASVLLERIRAEKEELIKQGKIKRDKKESVIFRGEDNSYYDELPAGWCGTTLRQITTPLELNDGDWILSDNMNPNGSVKLLQLGSIGYMEYIDKGFKHLTEDTFAELNCTEIYSDYLLINRIISDRMCCCIIPNIDGKVITTVDTCWVAPNISHYNLKYLMFFVASPSFQKMVIMNSSGTTRKRISKNNLIDLPIALPPLSEQNRIVEAIETTLAQLDKIAEALV